MKETKLISTIITALIISGCFTGCACKHEKWIDATCTTPKTCEECSATEGEPLGHKWKEATCESPKICEICNATEGEPSKEHTWIDATCTEAKTCSVCGETEGTSLGHDWSDADCQTAATCKRCGETLNTLGSHTTDKGKCSVCGKYFLDNAFIPASVDFASYGTYGEETGTSLTNCTKSDPYNEDHLTYFDVTATPVESMCIDNCDIEVELKYWDIKEDGNGALMSMYVSYFPTDGTDTSELAKAISDEFDMRYNLEGSYNSKGLWTNNTGNLNALLSVITSPNCVFLILDLSI